MRDLLVIGSGISGLSAAIIGAKNGLNVTLVSPFSSERAQSVMAAGGINAAIKSNDSVDSHVSDTYNGGCCIEDIGNIQKLCQNAPSVIKFLEELGCIFTRDNDGTLCVRAFGGQQNKRTVFSGSSTGKHIVSALSMKCRQFEADGKITRLLRHHFYSALIKDGECYGALLYDETENKLKLVYSDALVMATGGQNVIFGKTTGSTLCDGYAQGRLFCQGVRLRNLEFIQYHPTSIETSNKRMLITEAARGEGGRLFYVQNNSRVYFMEEQYGKNGNLMPRDIVSRCIYNAPSQVYLDISFLGKDVIHSKLEEVYELCKDYINIDVTKQPIPVAPAVHFFMGGIWVDTNHQSNISRLFAVGECASIYHGANRLGGNSLLAAVYGPMRAVEQIVKYNNVNRVSFEDYYVKESKKIEVLKESKSPFLSYYIQKELSNIMLKNLGVSRNQKELEAGIAALDFYLKTVPKMFFDPDMSIYENYRINDMLILAKAIMLSALCRKESRGAHYREDFPNINQNLAKASIAEYKNGEVIINYEEDAYHACEN